MHIQIFFYEKYIIFYEEKFLILFNTKFLTLNFFTVVIEFEIYFNSIDSYCFT